MNPDDTKEYLRRNLLVAKAYGAHAEAEMALRRLEKQPRSPLWLREVLRRVMAKTHDLPTDLAKYRDSIKTKGEAA